MPAAARTAQGMTIDMVKASEPTCFMALAFHCKTNGGQICGISSHFGLVLTYRTDHSDHTGQIVL